MCMPNLRYAGGLVPIDNIQYVKASYIVSQSCTMRFDLLEVFHGFQYYDTFMKSISFTRLTSSNAFELCFCSCLDVCSYLMPCNI